MTDSARVGGPPERKPYRAPMLRTFGNIQEITLGVVGGFIHDANGKTGGNRTNV